MVLRNQAKFRYASRELDSLENTLSSDRLATYIQTQPGDRRKAVRLYERNTAISESLYTPLQGMEIALRNSIHSVLSANLGRQDWYDTPGLLTYPQSNMLAKAKQQLRAQETPSRIVAELSFGFWVGLTGGQYNASLWMPYLHQAFPNVRIQRRPCHNDLDRIRKLRNRIMHHEPILSRDLKGDHARIINIIGWVCLDSAKWVEQQSRFPTVYNGSWWKKLITKIRPD